MTDFGRQLLFSLNLGGQRYAKMGIGTKFDRDKFLEAKV
jgi:hypothetical protein